MYKKWSVKILCMFIALTTALSFSGCSVNVNSSPNTAPLSSWADHSEIKQDIINYVSKAVDEKSDNYVPEEDRIAAFDIDGTLLCEKPYSFQERAVLYYAEHNKQNDPDVQKAKDDFLHAFQQSPHPSNFYDYEDILIGQTFKGLTEEEISDYIESFLDQHRDDLNQITYKESAYQPMIDLIHYLQENKFSIFFVSGSDQGIVWALEDHLFHMPRTPNIGIGSTYEMTPDHQTADTAKEDYLYQPNDSLVRMENLKESNIDVNKVYHIYNAIGKAPIMAFGNSSGDYSMLNFALSNEKYKGFAAIVNHDDAAREYDYSVTDLDQYASKYDWHVISMKNDFKKMFMNES